MNKLDKTYTDLLEDTFDNMYREFCIGFHERKMELYYSMPIRLQSLKEADPISQQEFLKDLAINN